MITRLKELLFQNRGARQTITKNAFWLTFSQITSRFIRAAIIIYSARVLGASGYGVFSYLLSLAGMFTIFSDIGINQIMTKEITQKPERTSEYFSTAFWIKIILFSVTATLVIFVGPYFSKIPITSSLFYIIAAIIIFDGLREFSQSIFRAREKMELEAFASVLTNISVTVLGFTVLYFSVSLKLLTLSYAIATGIGAFAAMFIIRKEFKKIFSHFEKNLIKPLIASSWPVALMGIIGAFMLNTDIIMLGWWKTTQEIGFYSAGQKIIQMLYSFPAILAGATFPTLSRLIGQQNNEKSKRLMEISMIATFLMAVPMTIGGIVLGKSIIPLIYGNEYLPAIIPFQILMTTMLIIFPGTLIGNAGLAYGKQKKMATYLAIAAFGNVILNAVLIPVYGIIGSAIATLISQLISNSLSWRMIKKINGFEIFVHVKKIVLAAIIMGITSFVFDKFGLNVIINIVISAAIYFAVLYALKEKTMEEIKTLFKLARITPQ
ncbi:flippase [Candidatus Wolfebacteria bacterium]|nr:flippase [Candidatus Wolfebacteria bacterium]